MQHWAQYRLVRPQRLSLASSVQNRSLLILFILLLPIAAYLHTCQLFDMLQVFEWVKNHGGESIIPFSGVFESKLVDMPEDERLKYCKEVSSADRAWRDAAP